MPDRLLQPPSWNHWFGTDLSGRDVFSASLSAVGVEILNLLVVAAVLHGLALLLAGLFILPSNRWLRATLPQAIHFWSWLPHLLLATLLVVLVGPGQLQIMLCLIAALISAHILYALSLFWEGERQDFLTTKLALGLSHPHALLRDVVPWVNKRLIPFTAARLPEIVMLHLALSFLGFGVRPPGFSLGRMLFDGLPFMFTAWWIWVFPSVFAMASLIAATVLHSKLASTQQPKGATA